MKTHYRLIRRGIRSNAFYYPSPDSWGNLPSYGFYFRYIDGLQLVNVELKSEGSDPREAIISEDCINVVDHHVTGKASAQRPLPDL